MNLANMPERPPPISVQLLKVDKDDGTVTLSMTNAENGSTTTRTYPDLKRARDLAIFIGATQGKADGGDEKIWNWLKECGFTERHLLACDRDAAPVTEDGEPRVEELID